MQIPVRGEFRMRVYRAGQLVLSVCEPNLVVDAGLTLVAQRIGGSSATQFVNRIGFGTSGAAVGAGDTALVGGVTRAIGSVSYPSAGKVRFEWTLPEAEGNGVAIQEFGLLAGNILVARKVRARLDKTNSISIDGNWTLVFG